MRTRTLIKLFIPVFVMALGVVNASAGAFDFTNLNGGVEGSLGTSSVTDGGVTATGWNLDGFTFTTADLSLWLRNEPNDHGLGICTTLEDTSGGGCAGQGGDYNELSNELSLEVLQLDRGDTTTAWTSVFLSSLDGNGGVSPESGGFAWSNDADPNTADILGFFFFSYGIFGAGVVEGDILAFAPAAAADARYLYFFSGDLEGEAGDNDYLVWKGVTADPIPEPATLLLLGSGLVGAAARARRRLNKA